MATDGSTSKPAERRCPLDSTRTNVTMTTTQGAPIDSNQFSLTAGPRGPLLMQDHQLMEKYAHQNRERIPERTVHAKGSGAYGTLTITHDITRYSKAAIFSQVGKKTDMLLRFSIVAGELGAADADRDVRGFAMKFYTEQGNWDLVGNNTPIFFVRDPVKFPDFIHTQKRHPKTNLRSNTAKWDFWSLSPESVHQVTILHSDRGLPTDYRHMDGFGSHTFSLINAQNERTWVKFHFKSLQGHRYFTDDEARRVIARSRETSQEDLYDAIERGDFPRWRMYIQVMSEEQAEQAPFDPFDLTKVWPHGDYPMIEVGMLELNRNPDNFFQEIEQAAFSPASVVPGISFSPDKMLQGRIFSYPDAHRYRLGVNHQSLPVNAPRCPVFTYNRDGLMNFLPPLRNPDAYYEPNSFSGPRDAPEFLEPPLKLDGPADRYDHRKGNDDFSQCRKLFELFDDGEKSRLFDNVAGAMEGVPDEIIERQLGVFERVHPDYAAGVRKAVDKKKKEAADKEAADKAKGGAKQAPHAKHAEPGNVSKPKGMKGAHEQKSRDSDSAQAAAK